MSKKLIRRAMPIAIADLKYWQQSSDKKYQRIKTIIEQLCINPKVSIGKPEPLKGDKTGLWSCRIDQKHRLVYSFNDEYLYIWRSRYHYADIPDQSSIDEAIDMNNENH
ncbi:Addiction module toxin, Txe/YoeB [Beggiatoa sp. PS]|nr:Addiction module toxin, Txe/YoeB [Beggiatoa sp. PS]